MEEHERKTTRVIVSLHLEQKQCSSTLASLASELKQLKHFHNTSQKQTHQNHKQKPSNTDTIAMINSQLDRQLKEKLPEVLEKAEGRLEESLQRSVAFIMHEGTIQDNLVQLATIMHGSFNRLFHEVQALFLATKFIFGTHCKGSKEVLNRFQSFFRKCSDKAEDDMPEYRPHTKLTSTIQDVGPFFGEFGRQLTEKIQELTIDPVKLDKKGVFRIG